jgi:hypothetical protein
MTPKRERQLGLSATTFLILCLWLGPHVTVPLLFVIAIAVVWFLACKRWPLFAVFTIGFLRGLFRR